MQTFLKRVVSSFEGNNRHMNKNQKHDLIDIIIRVCWGGLEKVAPQGAGEEFPQR